MNEGRPYASLSSGLLARKGAAKPAMRPQAYGSLEDLGWNDMGYGPAAEDEAPAPIPEHVPSPITALTPAPRPGEIDPETFYGEEEESELETEAGTEPEAGTELEAETEFEAETETETETEIEAAGTDAPPIPVAEESPAVADAREQEDHSVVAQQRAILQRFDGEEEAEAFAEPVEPAGVPARKPRAAVVPLPKRAAASAPASSSAGRKAAFTLRLDTDRHLRLRLACAVTGRSAQQIVSEALDAALAEIPEIEALAARVPAKAGSAGAKRN